MKVAHISYVKLFVHFTELMFCFYQALHYLKLNCFDNQCSNIIAKHDEKNIVLNLQCKPITFLISKCQSFLAYYFWEKFCRFKSCEGALHKHTHANRLTWPKYLCVLFDKSCFNYTYLCITSHFSEVMFSRTTPKGTFGMLRGSW